MRPQGGRSQIREAAARSFSTGSVNEGLEHGPIKLNRDHGLAFCLSMIFSENRFRDHALEPRFAARCPGWGEFDWMLQCGPGKPIRRDGASQPVDAARFFAAPLPPS